MWFFSGIPWIVLSKPDIMNWPEKSGLSTRLSILVGRRETIMPRAGRRKRRKTRPKTVKQTSIIYTYGFYVYFFRYCIEEV